jgi:hypothetical protein
VASSAAASGRPCATGIYELSGRTETAAAAAAAMAFDDDDDDDYDYE